jgi:hypothetical protein
MRILINASLIVLLVFVVDFGSDSAEKMLIKRYMDTFEVKMDSEELVKFSSLNRSEQAVVLYGGEDNIRKISEFSRFMGYVEMLIDFAVSVAFVAFVLGRLNLR